MNEVKNASDFPETKVNYDEFTFEENKKTPSARILEFLRDEFVDGIDTFLSHKQN